MRTYLERDVALPQPTVHRWLNPLETAYLLVRLPADTVNGTKRLIKAPKLYWSDTGLALHLAGAEPQGSLLDQLLRNLSKRGINLPWSSGRGGDPEASYLRQLNGDDPG